MPDFKLSFSEYVMPDKVLLEVFGGMQNFNLLLEMAKGAGTVSKMEILYDDHDLEFLHQFPPVGPDPWQDDIWTLALQWRYSEGLLRVAEYWALAKEHGGAGGTDQNPDVDMSGYYHYMARNHTNVQDYNDKEDVNLHKWDISGKRDTVLRIYHFKKIKTGAVDLWERLQDPKNQDLDLTYAVRAAAQERDALHQFNSTVGVAQFEAVRRNLKTWLLLNKVGVLKRDEWQGQPVGQPKPVALGSGQGDVYQLPVTKVTLPGYTMTIVTPKGGVGQKSKSGPQLKSGDTITVSQATYESPVLAPAAYVSALTDNKREVLLKALGIDPEATMAQLVQIPMYDHNRNAQTIKAAIDKHRQELDISDILYQKIMNFLRETQVARNKVLGTNDAGPEGEALNATEPEPEIEQPTVGGKKRGRPKSAEKMAEEKAKADAGLRDLANLRMANLCMAFDPKFAESAWRDPAKMSAAGNTWTKERDLNNLLVNYEHLSDKDKKTIGTIVPKDVVRARKLEGQKKSGDDEVPGVWVGGGMTLAKTAFQQVGYGQLKKKFSQDQIQELWMSHFEAAKAIIRSAAASGKLAGFKLSTDQQDELVRDKDNDDIAKKVADRAILSYAVFYAKDDNGQPMDAAQIAKTVVDMNRIRALISSILGFSRRDVNKLDSIDKGVPGKGDKDVSQADLISGDQGALSDKGGKLVRGGRRRLKAAIGQLTTGNEEVFNSVKYQMTMYMLAQRFQTVEAIWDGLVKKHKDAGKSQSVAEQLAKEEFRAALEHHLKMDLNGQKTGVSTAEGWHSLYLTIKDKLAKGEKIEAPKAEIGPIEKEEAPEEEIPSTIDALADTSDYRPPEKVAGTEKYQEFALFVKKLKLEAFDTNISNVIYKMAFEEHQPIEEVEAEVAEILYNAKRYFEAGGIPKPLFEEHWKAVLAKVRDELDYAREEAYPKEEPEEKPAPKQPEPAQAAAPPTATTTTTSPQPVLPDNHAELYARLKAVYDKAAVDPGYVASLASKPNTLPNLLKVKAGPLVQHYADLRQMVDDLIQKVKAHLPAAAKMEAIFREMSLPIGYPPYGNKVRKALGPDANCWGTPNNSTGVGPSEEPIKSKKRKSLKEYLEESRQNTKLSSFRERLEARLNGK